MKGFVKLSDVAHEEGKGQHSENGTIILVTQICWWIRVGDFVGCQRDAKTSMT